MIFLGMPSPISRSRCRDASSWRVRDAADKPPGPEILLRYWQSTGKAAGWSRAPDRVDCGSACGATACRTYRRHAKDRGRCAWCRRAIRRLAASAIQVSSRPIFSFANRSKGQEGAQNVTYWKREVCYEWEVGGAPDRGFVRVKIAQWLSFQIAVSCGAGDFRSECSAHAPVLRGGKLTPCNPRAEPS